jgi:hypothetical protein
MPYDPYEDPEIRAGIDDTSFPLNIKFETFGDRVRGVVVSIDRWDPPPRGRDDKPQPILKYRFAEAVVSQRGRQERVHEAEMLAGQVNLRGQLLTQKPSVGDEVDITYTSDGKKTQYGNAPKIFKVEVLRSGGQQPEPRPEPAEPFPAEPLRVIGGDDLFDPA